MILVDVNVLVYAFREGADQHQEYADWLNAAREASQGLLLPDVVLSGFLRLVSNPRVMDPPTSMPNAMKFALDLRRTSRTVESSTAVWRAFEQLAAEDAQIKANLVPDCYLAAVALAHRASLATRDRGFGRFRGLRFFDPVSR